MHILVLYSRPNCWIPLGRLTSLPNQSIIHASLYAYILLVMTCYSHHRNNKRRFEGASKRQ
ncbi:hypothetical protein BDB01DRAFT_783697 [Pilobolus umbonatus]|nr:hypothetical protein BDB01DRAFT_783697 [Pilobolus umbonatus]